MKISPTLAKKALSRLANKSGFDTVQEVALGILALINDEMCKALKIVSLERGIDPRDFALIAFGGAGPMHACAMARELQTNKLVIPQYPGLFSAFGCLVADIRREYSTPLIVQLSSIPPSEIEKEFVEMEKGAMRDIRVEKVVDPTEIEIMRSMDMRYQGQSFELLVPVEAFVDERSVEKTITDFHKRHEMRYGYASHDESVEVVNLRISVIGSMNKPTVQKKKIGHLVDVEKAFLGERQVFFEEIEGFQETPIYNRDLLYEGSVVKGPAVVEQYDSTTVISPGWVGVTQANGSMALEKQ